MDDIQIDEMARSGYRFAATGVGIPVFRDEMEVLAFNAGISNYNSKNERTVLPIMPKMKTTYIQGSNNGTADKELAIVGA